jgi:hypothetical protein
MDYSVLIASYPSDRRHRHFYWLIIALMLHSYLFGGFILPSGPFPFDLIAGRIHWAWFILPIYLCRTLFYVLSVE